jgi:cobalt-zinc-cadmium resistance protein CzcA
MLQGIINAAFAHPWTVFVLVVLVCCAGVVSLNALPVDAFPDTTPVQVQINTTATALVPEEVERQITFPIELAIGGMPHLEQLRSVSQFGLSQVVVTFEDGTDIYFARQLINERINGIEFAPGIPRPQMGPVSTGLGEVFHYMLRSDTRDLTELRTLHDWTIKSQLRPVPGTAEVNSWGGFEKQYQVRVHPALLIKHELTFEQVMNSVKENNLNVGGGNLERAGEMLLVHGLGRTIDIEQIGNMTVAARQGVPVHLRDVAEVIIGHESRRGAVTADGQGEVVLGLGFMLMGENSYAVTKRMGDKLETIAKQLPSDTDVIVVYDRTQLVDQVIDTVRQNLCDGALLVVAILFMFLGDLRTGLVVAAAIPLSMLFAFCGMYSVGIAGTLLSLGAIDFGVVVDSSVVMVENIYKRLAHQECIGSRKDIVRQAAIEVCRPVLFGQLIIMIVYVPLLTLQGVEGKMFRPMAMTVMLILVGSLLVSLAVMPVLAWIGLPKNVSETEVGLVRLARRVYEPLLDTSQRHAKSLAGLAVLLVGGAVVLLSQLGSEFVPRLSEGSIVIGIARPAGASLSESLRMNTLLERQLLQAFPDEIVHCWGRIGAPEVATDPSGVEMTDLFISLTPTSHWKKAHTQDELVAAMEKEISDIPGQLLWFTQPIEQRINEMISGVRSDVAVKVFGDDLNELIQKGNEIEHVLRTMPGAADIVTEQVSGQPVLQVRIRQDEIARYAVPAATVLELIEAVGGKPVGDIVEGQYRFPLVMRLPESLRENAEAIASMSLATPNGEQLPLSRLADIRIVDGPKTISREWGKRRITVQCNVRGRDVGSFVEEAQRAVAKQVEVPADKFRIEWGGQFENMQRAQQRLMIVVPAALGLILLLLYLNYRNWPDSLLVFSSVPLACVGGVVAIWLRGMPMSISAAVGFITLCGVSVLNSMVIVAALRTELEKGTTPLHAIRRTSLEGLRTVMMTALVASVGFIPMAISTGVGAEVQRPLATVVIGGIFSSTLMTLLILPALYTMCLRPALATIGGRLGGIGPVPLPFRSSDSLNPEV